MKRLAILIFNLLFCISVCQAQYFAEDSPFYPCLDNIVGNYHNFYFRFPNKVKDLIQFTESLYEVYPDWDSSCKNNLTMKILPYLKKNMKQIIIEEDEGYNYTIRMGRDTLLHVPSTFWPFSPCDNSLFIGGSSNEYYHFYDEFLNPRFYSSHGRIILYPKSVYQDFKKEILNIQQKHITLSSSSLPYKYYVYENDTVPIVAMLEYNIGKPLRYYCSGQPIKSKLTFYEKLESYLQCFCKLHKCKQILFMLPDYNLTNELLLEDNPRLFSF